MEKDPSADPRHRLDSFQWKDPDYSHKSFIHREVIKIDGRCYVKSQHYYGTLQVKITARAPCMDYFK